jgi:hypothetical protein
LTRNAKFQQNFILIYYLYLIYCHRILRKAPQRELLRLKELVIKLQPQILKNYADSKRSQVSQSELLAKKIISENQAYFKFEEIDEEKQRVIQVENMHFLLLPTEKVKDMVVNEQNLIDFGEKCLLIPYSIDILSGDLAFEVNGPFHYFRDINTESFVMNGHTKLKREFINKLKLRYIEIPFWEIDKIHQGDSEEQRKILESIIQRGSE